MGSTRNFKESELWILNRNSSSTYVPLRDDNDHNDDDHYDDDEDDGADHYNGDAHDARRELDRGMNMMIVHVMEVMMVIMVMMITMMVLEMMTVRIGG